MNVLGDLPPTSGNSVFTASNDPDDVLVLLIVCVSAVAVLAIVLSFLSRTCTCLTRVSLLAHEKRRGVEDADKDIVEPLLATA
ncbi:hypothetical protein ACHHYP_09708 [Achlya hypogyna]|uniref:Uncharacterized protein n=1 Tax=Achlya hypogyna TaxID=1202772 RepID=A0A1V9YML7_ACHHY|nr:hypothetical protein ACHHYP_09708 [Achlya hypogyna]